MGGEGAGPLGIMTESSVWQTERNACEPRVAGAAAGRQEVERESSGETYEQTDGRMDGRPVMSRDLMIVGRGVFS